VRPLDHDALAAFTVIDFRKNDSRGMLREDRVEYLEFELNSISASLLLMTEFIGESGELVGKSTDTLTVRRRSDGGLDGGSEVGIHYVRLRVSSLR